MSERRLAILASLAGLSGLVVAMIVVRVVYSGNNDNAELVWNLFLAWIPFLVALQVYEGYRRGAARLYLLLGGVLWLLFFPNAPYIVTDFKWLTSSSGAPIWYDVVLISAGAWAGLLLGFISLYLMQAVMRRALGALSAWLFVLAALVLSSFGIYLGRFQRSNSWDVLVSPRSFAGDVFTQLNDPNEYARVVAVTVLFTAFLGATYLVFYSFVRATVREPIER
jgi:uncharacterized membrane protein